MTNTRRKHTVQEQLARIRQLKLNAALKDIYSPAITLNLQDDDDTEVQVAQHRYANDTITAEDIGWTRIFTNQALQFKNRCTKQYHEYYNKMQQVKKIYMLLRVLVIVGSATASALSVYQTQNSEGKTSINSISITVAAITASVAVLNALDSQFKFQDKLVRYSLVVSSIASVIQDIELALSAPLRMKPAAQAFMESINDKMQSYTRVLEDSILQIDYGVSPYLGLDEELSEEEETTIMKQEKIIRPHSRSSSPPHSPSKNERYARGPAPPHQSITISDDDDEDEDELGSDISSSTLPRPGLLDNRKNLNKTN
jgi:hypothetical protein